MQERFFLISMLFQSIKKTANPDLVYGIHAVLETIHASKEINKIFVQKDLKSDGLLEIKQLAFQKKLPLQQVPAEKLNSLTTKNHQGVVALVSPVEYYKLDLLIASLFEQGVTPLFLVLDRITDTRNFGAIARSALCAGAHALVVPEKNAAGITADSLKTSAGALASLPVVREPRLEATLNFLRNSGFWVIAASEKSSKPYFNADYTGPTAIVLGSEEDGILPSLLEKCHDQVRIPIQGPVESLNVSAAAAVMLFEAVKQRG